MKTNNIFMIFAILMATIFSACSEHMAEEIGEATATPKYWEPTSDFYTSAEGVFVNVNIIFDDINVTKPARHTVSLLTEDSITAVGDYPFFCEEDLAEGKEAKVSMQYSYCYNKTNTIKVNGLVMSYEYNGKTYSLPCASTITVVGSMTEAVETEAGLANSTVYTAVANGKKLAKGVQEFLAVKPNEPEPKPEAQPTGWKQDGDKAVIIFDDGTEVIVPNTLTMTAEKRYEVEGTVAATCNNLTVDAKDSNIFAYNHGINNTVKVNGNMGTMDYKEWKNIPCLSKFTIEGVISADETSKSGYEFWWLGHTEYTLYADGKAITTATQEFLVSKAEEVKPAQPTGWKQDGDKAVIIFDDGTEVTVPNTLTMTAEKRYEVEGTVAATCNNLKVDAKNSNIFTYNHGINNTVKVNGNMGTMDYKEWKNIPCLSKFTIEGVISADETSKSGYEFWWLGHTEYTLYADGKAITTATQEFLVSKARTKTDVSRSYEHDTFQNKGILSGSTISILCDNIAKFIQKYSDGSQDDVVSVNYTVTNTFGLTMPKFKVNATTDIVGVKADLVNGQATVLGQNISVNFKSADVSAIMFDGKDYRNEAPKCKVYAKSIEFITIDKAVITFVEENGNTVATIEVPVSVVVISIIPGDVVELFATDHYNGRTLKGTGIHARRADGTVYSFEIGSDVNGGTVTTTSVTGTYAWIWNTKSWELGLVEASKGDNSDVSEYIIKYYTLNKQLANALGYAEATLNGKGFRNPVHTVTYDEATGVWTITVEGKSYFYASQN